MPKSISLKNIQHALVSIEGEKPVVIDAIDHEGRLWLVPKWLPSLAEGLRIPAYLVGVPLNDIQVGKGRIGKGLPYDFSVRTPMPKPVLDGRVPPELAGKYEVVKRPALRFPNKPTVH